MLIVLVVAIAVTTAIIFFLWVGQERILFQPPAVWEREGSVDHVEFRAQDGQRLLGYVVGDAATASHALLCFHGNADLAMWQKEWAREVALRADTIVFLAEYRGYMSLNGSPTYATTSLDANAAYQYVNSTLQVPSENISYFGHSLGSAVATELALRYKPYMLLLQSPFTSARAMARLMVSPPIELIWSTVSRIHFDTLQAIPTLASPVSVAHGKKDRVVPFKMGLQIYEAAKQKGELLIVEQGGHNDLPQVAGEEYWKWITAALVRPAQRPQQKVFTAKKQP